MRQLVSLRKQRAGNQDIRMTAEKAYITYVRRAMPAASEIEIQAAAENFRRYICFLFRLAHDRYKRVRPPDSSDSVLGDRFEGTAT